MAALAFTSKGGKSGHHKAGCWITSRRRDATDSAAENRPPARKRLVRVKWRGKSSPRFWRQKRLGKPHPVQDQTEFRSRKGTWQCPRQLEFG